MIAEAFLELLQTLGHGTKNIDLFLSFQPDSPDNSITVYDVTAFPLEESHALDIDQFGVQVLVRNSSYITARDKTMAIHKDVAGLGGGALSPGTPHVSALFIDTPPTSIGSDMHGRAEWSAHYRMRVRSIGDLHRS